VFGSVTPDELQQMVLEGATLADIARHADVDRSTARRWLREHGLVTARMRRLAESQTARQAGHVEFISTCPHHGEALHRLDSRGTFRCTRCNGDRVARRRRTVKSILVAEAGGACTICGYDRCERALSFHHLDPTTKSFGVAFRGHARSLARARAEVAKCALLCANCHMEVEAGVVSVPLELAPDDPG